MPKIGARSIISIHALRVEGDVGFHRDVRKAVEFLSTPSGWRATASRSINRIRTRYFYPRPPGGGRLLLYLCSQNAEIISIHALRVEGDQSWILLSPPDFNFYPRPPGGGRLGSQGRRVRRAEFLSTPSGWRATRRCGQLVRGYAISIHALRVEGDMYAAYLYRRRREISIHALRVEGDWLRDVITAYNFSFLSTPSGWRATAKIRLCDSRSKVLSTPSGWRATTGRCRRRRRSGISIHALRVEGDTPFGNILAAVQDFYPCPPGGGRRVFPAPTCPPTKFLSTPSGWRATLNHRIYLTNAVAFLSTPSGWRATA